MAASRVPIRSEELESARDFSPFKREAIGALTVHANVSKELWKFRDYARAPVIERL